METNVYRHEDNSGDWVVETLNLGGEGEILTAIFSGPDSEARARQYLAWLKG